MNKSKNSGINWKYRGMREKVGPVSNKQAEYSQLNKISNDIWFDKSLVLKRPHELFQQFCVEQHSSSISNTKWNDSGYLDLWLFDYFQ